MGILHELLAAESALRSTANDQLSAAGGLFSSGKERFRGIHRKYYPEEEMGRDFPDEGSALATTVDEVLGTVARDFGAWIDASFQKEMTNTQARAELVIGGESLGMVSATALLNLESKMETLIRLYEGLPANDPTVAWTWDEENSCWRSPVDIRYKTEKRQEPLVMYDATKEHPAQTQLITRDVRVGRYETVVFSGMLSQSDLAERLVRAREILVAVKKARAKANQEKVVPLKIADKLFNFINNGSKPQR